ncbi:tol-pal system protein YbgF [uncultured Gilliamella sp.]|jgi:tol-pal system protein YbgF|uniref:tol-pal system protein YbgF n=1 Tax=uncultured Gilliamella sp. TaxID=1193505 RepID=UPI0025EB7FD6|nr:tol-pal system protein YbgF [uncultured Gilliamella sp.]
MYKKIFTLFLFLLFAGYGCATDSSEIERTVQAQGQLLIQSQQKINDLQSDVDALRGQLEETQYQLNQTIERQKMILQQMTNGSTFSSTTNDDSSIEESSSSSSKSSSTSSDLANWTTSGNDKKDYNFIMQFINTNKQPNESIAAFQKFLQNYPKSRYRANVNYWLGQLYFKQGKKDNASFHFATVVKNYSSSPKAADSLYKVGLILLSKGDKKNAKAVFQQVVNKYAKDKKTVNLAKKKLASL